MKIIFSCIFAIMMMANVSAAATFPASGETTVSIDGNGMVTVTAVTSESGWVLVQFCQDPYRPGCGNNQVIRASEDAGGMMRFQVDVASAKQGQSAFNFRNTKLGNNWLHIPDCRVKTGSNAALGMSYVDSSIPESGGAHFVYTGSGLPPVWRPVDMSACNESVKPVAAAPVKPVAPAKPVAAKAPPAAKKEAGVGQSVSNSPAAQAVQAAPKQKVSGIGNVAAQNAPTNATKGATIIVDGAPCKGEKADVDGKCKPSIEANTTSTTNQFGIFFSKEPFGLTLGKKPADGSNDGGGVKIDPKENLPPKGPNGKLDPPEK